MALERIDLDIYIYTGTQGTYEDTDLKYTLQKDRLSNQDNIVLEISQLVRDYIDITFDNDYTSTTVWVTIIENYIDSDKRSFCSVYFRSVSS